jgi:segregation and condensation protein B
MVPPRLSIVARNDTMNDDATSNAPDAAEARELARALAESEGGEVSAPVPGRYEKVRILEAVLFATAEPLDEARLAAHLSDGDNIQELLSELRDLYAGCGVNLVQVAGKWAFRTAADLSYLLETYSFEERRLSKAALETLAIVAYHQPVTRAEIEEIRGVSISAGTLDILMETAWIRPRGRRRAPGKPITYGTTDAFLSHFGLDNIKDLPGLSDLKAAGLLDGTLPAGFSVPDPSFAAGLMPDELPLEADEDAEDDGEEADEDVEAELDLDLPAASDTAKPDGSGD